jgi:hypothetical protein
MASEEAVVMLTLVGIGIIVVGAMILMQRPIEIENKREVVIRSQPPPSWVLDRDRGYSHWPVRPILL